MYFILNGNVIENSEILKKLKIFILAKETSKRLKCFFVKMNVYILIKGELK
ncbi:hypothetical protein SH2C18_26990 [Clostridium sediminicola]